MQGPVRVNAPGRPDIVNAGSMETRYSECRVQGRPIYLIGDRYMNVGGPGTI
ncbi:unnamed protein product [Staurois parvus]|uniref:Uncharacterized protein n=1 Tax=Staurois parvus TaxID=386267 RepID=A0ABN9BUJ3_9NEOB|nr:unnamed protein product [Staurois parvus]